MIPKSFLILLACVSMNASHIVGNTTVGDINTVRTVIVAQDGTGDYRTIQAAANSSLPGDLIEVKNGTYFEAPLISRSGTSSKAIVYQNYPGHRPTIHPSGNSGSELTVSGNWIYLIGFEITNGYSGILAKGNNNAYENNWIHNSGDSCNYTAVVCGQGIIMTGTQNLVMGNNIEKNGLKNYNNFQLHGLYVSDYYSCGCITNISVINNTFAHHGGGGIQFYQGNAIDAQNVLIQGNTFFENAEEIILVNVRTATIKGNTFTHDLNFPTTNAPRDSVFWIESSTGLTISSNTINYNVLAPSNNGYKGNFTVWKPGSSSGTTFSNNLWNAICGYNSWPLSDAAAQAGL